MTMQELLTVLFTFMKIRDYFFGIKVIVHIDHVDFRYLMVKKGVRPILIQWVLLL